MVTYGVPTVERHALFVKKMLTVYEFHRPLVGLLPTVSHSRHALFFPI